MVGSMEQINTQEYPKEQKIFDDVVRNASTVITKEIKHLNKLVKMKITGLIFIYMAIFVVYKAYRYNWILCTGLFFSTFYVTLLGVAYFKTEWMCRIFGVRKIILLLIDGPIKQPSARDYVVYITDALNRLIIQPHLPQTSHQLYHETIAVWYTHTFFI